MLTVLASFLTWMKPKTSRGVALADQVMGLLRRAVAEGYCSVKTIAKEVALDPLRTRPDFRLLMLDLNFPTAPFAR